MDMMGTRHKRPSGSKTWLLLIFCYVENIIVSSPNLIQIIVLPSALGFISKLNPNQMGYLAFFTALLLSCYSLFTSEDSFDRVYKKYMKKSFDSEVDKIEMRQKWEGINYFIMSIFTTYTIKMTMFSYK